MSNRKVIPAEWFTGRGQPLYGRVLEATDGGDEGGKDLSGAGVSVRFRAYQAGADAAYLKEVTLTETSGTGGYYTGYIPAFTAEYASLVGEIVLVDTGTADAGTPTGYKEILLEQTYFAVRLTAT